VTGSILIITNFTKGYSNGNSVTD